MIALEKKEDQSEGIVYYPTLGPRNALIRVSRVSLIKSHKMNHELLYFMPEATGKWTQIDF
jgi:hypothetical protein